MTEPRSRAVRAATGPSASGARIGGDDVQHLIAWYWILKACAPGSGIAAVTVEAADGESVDDVVVDYDDGSRRWVQVKASVAASSGPLDVAWLTAPPSGKKLEAGTKTLLRQLYRSWAALGRPASGVMLVTTRPIDAGDPLLQCLDHTSRVGTRLRRAANGSASGKLRADLAAHVGWAEEDLLAFFDVLEFHHSQTERWWRDKVDDAAVGAGVQTGAAAQAVGLAEVREWIKTTRDPRGRAELVELMARLGLRVRSPRALVVVEALDRVRSTEDAVVALDWIESFRGDQPENRRGLIDPAGWTTSLAGDLVRMRETLLDAELRSVAVRGVMRLPGWFAVGATLREVAGFNVAADCRERLWEPPVGSFLRPLVQVRTDDEIGDGEDVVLVVEMSSDATDPVRLAFSGTSSVGRLVAVTVTGGPDPRLFRDGTDVMAAAYAVRDWVRTSLPTVPHLHLVLVGPAAFALFLGHVWDRVPPTTIYEDLLVGYEPAFRFAG